MKEWALPRTGNPPLIQAAVDVLIEHSPIPKWNSQNWPVQDPDGGPEWSLCWPFHEKGPCLIRVTNGHLEYVRLNDVATMAEADE